jgi:hypothetical protein
MPLGTSASGPAGFFGEEDIVGTFGKAARVALIGGRRAIVPLSPERASVRRQRAAGKLLLLSSEHKISCRPALENPPP